MTENLALFFVSGEKRNYFNDLPDVIGDPGAIAGVLRALAFNPILSTARETV